MVMKTVGSKVFAAYTRRAPESTDAMIVGVKNAGRNQGNYDGAVFFVKKDEKLLVVLDKELLAQHDVEICVADSKTTEALLTTLGL